MGVERSGGMIWLIGSLMGMILVHGLLLIIHRSGVSRPRSGNPSSAELYFGIALFWTSQHCFGRFLVIIRDTLAIGLFDFAGKDRGRKANEMGDVMLGWIWDDLPSIFRMASLTWCIHLILVFVIDTGIPFLSEVRQNPQKTLRKMGDRSKEILGFLGTVFEDPLSSLPNDIPGAIPENSFKPRGQTIQLQRRQTEYTNEGERRLSWSIAVDKDAMNEMKETLGPPGGFGELGFNVARDGVRFEAMGVGTSFNLMFKLREGEDGPFSREKKSTRKQK